MTSIQHISQPVSVEMDLCRQRFDSFMTHNNVLLNEVLQRVASRKGKMMRPLLTLLSAKLLGEIGENTLLAALTFEFFHTASLIHDDIVDESAVRRGEASVNRAYDNKVAVLVGDFILANALDTASSVKHSELVAILSRTAKMLADGELLQLHNIQNQELSEEVYFHIIKGKTAALFAACAEAGALSVTDNKTDIERLQNFGEIVGTCFQIRDDIFDYVSGSEIGKPTGNDLREGKVTLPLIHALNVTNNAQMLHLVHMVKESRADHDTISTLVNFAVNSGGIEYAEQQMKRIAQQAHDLLDTYPDSPTRQALHNYIDYVITRSH